MKNKKYDEVIVKIERIESSKEKVKLYLTVENNLDDKEYYMYGDILGSFKIKDQDSNDLKPYKKDFKQEKGGDLDDRNITLKPGESASGWVSFINPDDRRISEITVEGDEDMFDNSEKITL